LEIQSEAQSTTEKGMETKGAKRRKTEQIWRPKEQKDKIVRMGQEEPPKNPISLIKEVCREKLQWLNKSHVCESDEPRDVDCLYSAMANGIIEAATLRDMGLYRFLLTLDEEQDLLEMLNHGDDWLSNWFVEVRRWRDDICYSRRTWIEVLGLPSHAWCRDNFRKIEDQWGDLICLDTNTANNLSFACARLLIDTAAMRTIDSEIIFSVEDEGLRDWIKESKGYFGSLHSRRSPRHCSDDS